jgi:hypothetical protein
LPSERARAAGVWLDEQLRIRSWARSEFSRQLTAVAQRSIKQNQSDRWVDGETQPSWDNAILIWRVLELPWDVVRAGLAYTDPDALPPARLQPWEVDTQARGRRLQDILHRVPMDARTGVGAMVDAFLGFFASEVDRLNSTRT